MQFPGQGKPPLGIVFDSDMGNGIDDALALALLYGLDGKNEARVISLSVSKSNLNSAALCEVIGRFYSGEVSGAFAAAGRTLPTGMATDGISPGDTPMLTVPLSKRTAEGNPVYAHGIHKLVDTAEVPALIRNAFTSQYDDNSAAVLAGPANNLAAVLALPGVKDLLVRKARYLCAAAGAFDGGPPDPAIAADIRSAKKVFAEWPTPIVAVGREVGEALPFPASSIEKDFDWSANHPVVDAYRAFRRMPYDAPAPAMAAVLYAVRPKEGYFKLSDPGTIQVLEDGTTRFTPSAEGRHRYLIFDPDQRERVLKAYTEIASAKPAPRRPRFPRQQKKQEPPKPAEVKPQAPEK